MGYPTSYQPRS